MPPSPEQQRKVLMRIAAVVVSLGAVVGLRKLIRYLLRQAALKKLQQARLESPLLQDRSLPKPQLIQLWLLRLKPSLEVAKSDLEEWFQKANFIVPGVEVSLSRYGSKDLLKGPFLGKIQRPDMSNNLGYCLTLVADDVEAAKFFLHSNIFMQEFFPLMFPHFEWHMDVMTDLQISLPGEDKEDSVLQIVALRFRDYVTDDSELLKTFHGCVSEFSKVKGICARLTHIGYDTLLAGETLEQMGWVDNMKRMTHTLLIAADDVACLQTLLHSEAFDRWLQTEGPHIASAEGEETPSAIVFHTPLRRGKMAAFM
mmetsp:Transcript_21288/g.45278  ORF Transcript_21288/g.45278 Transcript_21288/m.45278 type:complete len:312 (+) Transcript_21288:93-1028(+)